MDRGTRNVTDPGSWPVNDLLTTFDIAELIARRAVLALAVLSAVVFGSDWLVRTRRINPFNPVARFFRRTLDPLMAPVERRVIRSGGNPATAPWWTFAVVVVGGILLLAALDYVRQTAFELAAASHGGVMPIVRLLIHWTVLFLQLALIIRVIASWLGMGQFSPWVRWAYPVTDWFLRPLRRVIPPMGMFDISPIVAWFGLSLLEWLALNALSLLTTGL
jgi:YggT family protein